METEERLKKNKILTFRDLAETKQEKKIFGKNSAPPFVVCCFCCSCCDRPPSHLFCKRLKWAVFSSLTSLCLYIFRLLYDSLCVFFSLFHLCVCVCVLHLFFYIRFSRAQFPVSVCLGVCVCVLCLHKSKKCFCVYVFHRFAYMLLLFNFIQLIKNNLNKNNKIKT